MLKYKGRNNNIKMKIAIITPTFPPYAGGIGQVAFFNARELMKLGHEVTVFTPWYREVQEVMPEINVRRLRPKFKYGNAAYVPALKRELIGYDIIHLHYPFFGGAEVIWRQQRRLKKHGAKIVLHYHMDVMGEGFLRWFFKFHNAVILPRIINIADQVIFTSMDYGQNSNAAKFQKKFPAKFLAVPNGVDPEVYRPAERAIGLVARHNLKPEEKIVVFVGGLDHAHYFKGVGYLIEAMSRLTAADYRWRLIIVGEGELKSAYQDLASQLRVTEAVVFAGRVGEEELPQYYNLADVVVLPSIDKSEAFGLVLLEGMACGKPVVASDLAGVRSVVTDGQDGLLARPKDPDDLATKINFFLTNAAEAEVFGRAGRRKVLLKYDWAIIGRQLNELYKSLSQPQKK